MGQSEGADWKSIDASSSKEELKKMESFLFESYRWDFAEREAFLSKACKASEELEEDTLRFHFIHKLGCLYREADSISYAFDFLNKSIEYSYDAKTKRTAYNSMGGLFMKNEDYTSALDYYFKSLDEAKKLNDGSEAYPIGNISEIYSLLGDYENSIKYLKYSLESSSKLASPEKEYSLVYDCSYISTSFYEINEIDSCLKYIKLTSDNVAKIDTIKEEKFQDASFMGCFAIAEFYLNEGQLEIAKYFIDKTRKHAQPFYLSGVDMLEARYELKRENFNAAKRILDSERLNNEEYAGKMEVIKLKANYFKAIGDYKSYSTTQEELVEYQNKRFSQDKLKFSAFANAKYENFRKNEEIKSLQLDQKVKQLKIQNQQFLTAIISILGVLLAIGAIYWWMQSKRRKEAGVYLQEQIDLKTLDLQKVNEELRTLNYVASHDIKEPIRNIGNFVGLIKRGHPTKSDSDVNYYFEIIEKSIKQLYTLVEDIASYLSFSHGVLPTQEVVDVNTIIENLIFSSKTLLDEKKAEIKTDNFPEITTNSSLLFVILENLVENGLKFNDSEKPTVEILYVDKTDQHQILVKDNGIGIDSKYQTSIFDNFKRLHNRNEYNGTGMGLAIVKLLIEKLGGKVEVESIIGKESTFILTLPK